MKNQIQNIKKNGATEAKKAAFVILGFISGQALSKGLDMLVAKYPQIEPAVKIGKPIVLAGGGWLLSSATNESQNELKHLGYGLTVSGAFEGLKLIPIAKEYLNLGSLEGNFSGYYMENEKPLLELGDFGINALPVKSLDIENAPEVRLELPELDGAETELEGSEDDTVNGTDLGYDPERFEGII